MHFLQKTIPNSGFHEAHSTCLERGQEFGCLRLLLLFLWCVLSCCATKNNEEVFVCVRGEIREDEEVSVNSHL